MRWTRTLPSVAVLCLLAAALPMRLPHNTAAPSNEACLTLADQDARRQRPTVSTLEQCSALYPADVELLVDLAERYESSEPLRAESLLKRVVALDPDDGNVRLRLGRLLLRRGAAGEAHMQAAAGLKVQPNASALLDLLRAAAALTR